MTRDVQQDWAITPHRRHPAMPYAALVLIAAIASIAIVLVFQAVGYAPCELCLKERLFYYAAIALGVPTLILTRFGPAWAARLCLGVLCLLFLVSAGLGTYHAGVEWEWWPGPSTCTGTFGERAATSADFLLQLQTIPMRCDAASIRILGLSLAGWNAVASLAIALVAAVGALRAGVEQDVVAN